MDSSKLRRQIASDAARLMYERQESEYFRAKLKAARRLHRGRVKPADLPSNAEIRDEVQSLARMFEGDSRLDHLREMRFTALHTMKRLANFRPRLIGSVLTGHVRRGSDIDIHLFSDSVEPIVAALEREGAFFDVERKEVRKQGETQIYVHVHVQDVYPIELTVYPSDKAHYVFKSSITGKAMRRMSIRELEEFLTAEYPDSDADEELAAAENRVDRFLHYEMLLLPLEYVKQNLIYHPEGDALYHSLQAFELARCESPYDEDFLLAALLHDVGKAIDPRDHVRAGLEALGDTISQRTAWLIEHHMSAHALLEGTLGARAKRRLRQSEDYEDLLLLGKCDEGARQIGVQVADVREAIDYLRELSQECGDW
ncbi:MAG: HD domain-containing protein [Blastopirellula sp. JB062]